MSSLGAQAGLETFDALHIDYENAYKNNPFKQDCIEEAISLLQPGCNVVDVGCGTGVPVAQMLASAGMEVTGTDISPKMIHLARHQVKWTFLESDLLTYEPDVNLDGVFMIFCNLQLSYAEFHTAAYNFASALRSGGIFVIGEMPADSYVKDSFSYDETGVWVENYPIPFWGEPLPTFMMTAKGLLDFLISMDLKIISNTIGTFQPNNTNCAPEEQQYVIARRTSSSPLPMPRPLPKP